MRPLRIAVVAACPFPWPRGTPIRIHRLSEALGERGHDVHVATYHLGAMPPPRHMTVHRIAGPSWYTRTRPGPSIAKLAVIDPLLVRTLRGLLQAQRFDVIHAHHYEGLLAALMARGDRPVPLVFDSHTLLEEELGHYGPALLAALARHVGRTIERRLPRRADHVISVSEEIRLRLEAAGHVAPDRISVIPNGVEVEHFRATHGTDTRADLLAFAGNLAKYQRIDLLLQSFAQVAWTRPAARLEILTGDDFRDYASLARRLSIDDRITVSNVDYASLPSRLAQASVLANPRIDCSGLPQKLLNYMASGTPTVSFAGSAKLLENEHSGLVVPDGDVNAFAAAVSRLMDDAALRSTLGARAQQVVAGDHTWQRVAERVEAVYERVRARA